MFPFFRCTQRSETSFPRSLDDKRRRVQRRVPVRLQLEVLEDRVVPSGTQITMPLVNDTGLNPAQYSVYVYGYGQANYPATPSLPATVLQSGGQFADLTSSSSGILHGYEISSTMSSITLMSLTPVNSGKLDFLVVPNGQTAPTFAYTTNSNNVLSFTNASPDTSAFGFVEFTEPADGTNYPTIDVSQVNSYTAPVTVTLNNNLGQIGQTLNPSVNQTDILSAYTTFTNNQGAAGLPYQALVSASNGNGGQPDVIQSPDQYLKDGSNSNSPLNAMVWTSPLNALFQPGQTFSLKSVGGAVYTGTSELLGTSSVIHFVGTNGDQYNIYSPLTKDPAGSYQTNESSGEMVFANDGVFSDTSTNVILPGYGGTTAVALDLERQLVAALNRGVATLGPRDGLAGDDTIYWNTQTNWYPANQTSNLYSMFLHTETVNGTPIFTLPNHAVADAQGTLMASAYGFPYDEGGPPTVPSKIEPAPNGTTTATITLGPWFQASPSPSPSLSPSPPSYLSPNGIAVWLALVEDQDAAMVDSLVTKVDATLMQAANDWFALCNNHFGLNNPVLGMGLESLESAIQANPYYGTIWGLAAEAAGLELATQFVDSVATQLNS